MGLELILCIEKGEKLKKENPKRDIGKKGGATVSTS
jgi:hypothetical protein